MLCLKLLNYQFSLITLDLVLTVAFIIVLLLPCTVLAEYHQYKI